MIFLRATHTELTKAGYTDLDPKHELFLLYRPKITEVYVTRNKLKMRETESLDSADMGTLPIGTHVHVLQRCELKNGKRQRGSNSNPSCIESSMFPLILCTRMPMMQARSGRRSLQRANQVGHLAGSV